MNCKYSFKNETSKYLNCNLTGEMCPMIRFCADKDEYVSSANYTTYCKEYARSIREESKKDGNNFVRFEKDGELYVELNDEDKQVKKFKNPYKYTPVYVDLVVVDGVYYIKGQEPQPLQEKKRTSKPKK